MKFFLVLCAGTLLSCLANTSPGGPVSKVVHLLEDLKDKIEVGEKEDQEAYEKDRCWCEKVKESKKEMIAKANAAIAKLTEDITTEKAEDEILDKEIELTQEEEAENVEDSEQGSNVRNKDHTEFVEEDETMTEAKSDITAAEGTLKGVMSLNFVQINSHQSKLERYEPKAQTIVGILDDQYHQVDDDQTEANATENNTARAFNSWFSEMQEDLGILTQTELDKQEEDAETEQDIAEDSKQKELTEEQKKADTAFLEEAIAGCEARAEDFTKRTDARNKELAGVNKALEILDEKRELLTKTFEKMPSFLQVDSVSAQASAARAAAAQSAFTELKRRASHSHSLGLAVLASKVNEAGLGGGAFDAVLKEIDGMYAKIKKQNADDVKKKDHCRSEYHDIATKTKNMKFLISQNSAKIEKMADKIAQLTKEKDAARAEVGEITADFNEANETRYAEHKAFKDSVQQDTDAMNVLDATMKELEKYYGKLTSLVEKDDYDPNKMSKKRRELKNAEEKYTLNKDGTEGATMILSLMQRIIDNLHKEIDESKAEEAEAQIEFDKSSGLLLATKEKLTKKIVSIDNMVASHTGTKNSEEDAKAGTEDLLKEQNEYKASITEECDHLLTNFDSIISDRESEMDGLTRAKELLSGAAPALLQKATEPEEQPTEDGSSLMNYLGLGN